MKLVALPALALVLVACAADGEMKVNASTNGDTNTSASASASVEGEGGGGGAAEPPERGEEPEKVTATASSEQPATCPLVCYVANKGRVAPADEQRLAGELASELTLLRSCGSSNVRPSLTLRFESSGQLTGFGVDAERGNEGACVNTVREHRPAVTYPGPATLRCSERCPGDSTRVPRRRQPT
ncbi:MAG: hypothetical protein KIT84_27675 [Labilithrix sp.]|nr:hypothetical protein [Labilithrix sp.]MCW5814839.1 hypothetical protein [Labilithrix sp.]